MGKKAYPKKLRFQKWQEVKLVLKLNNKTSIIYNRK